MRGQRITITIRKPLADWFRKRAREKETSLSSEIESSLESFCGDRVREGMKSLSKELNNRLIRG